MPSSLNIALPVLAGPHLDGHLLTEQTYMLPLMAIFTIDTDALRGTPQHSINHATSYPSLKLMQSGNILSKRANCP